MPKNKAEQPNVTEKRRFSLRRFWIIYTRESKKSAREKSEQLCPRRPQSVRENFGSTSPVNHPPPAFLKNNLEKRQFLLQKKTKAHSEEKSISKTPLRREQFL